MEYIAIRWDSGFMDVILDAFFPTSAARVRKLLRIIELDYAHRDELMNQVLQYCTERAQRTMDSRKGLANEAVDSRQRAADLQPRIDQCKRRILSIETYTKEMRSRMKAAKEELKKLESMQRAERAASKKKMKEFELAEKKAQQLWKNAEVITAWMPPKKGPHS